MTTSNGYFYMFTVVCQNALVLNDHERNNNNFTVDHSTKCQYDVLVLVLFKYRTYYYTKYYY